VNTTKRFPAIWLIAVVFAIGYVQTGSSQESAKQPLRPVQTISIPNVKGRLDHMDIDVKGKRLFVAGLENGTFEVVDLQAGKWIRSIPGFKKPQGALFVPELNKLFLASGDDGMLRVFLGDTLEFLDSIHLEPGPNRVVYEPKSKLVYVGYGGKDAGKDYGEVGIVDARNDKLVGDIRVVAHPSELLLDKTGTTLFVFISIANQLQVIDTNKRQVLSTWPVISQHPGDAAFDESTSRLFIGTHTPAEMTVMDSKSGKEVAHLPTAEGMDGVYFDSLRKRVYVSGGRDLPAGFAYVYQQKDADHYETIGKIPTRAGAGISLLVSRAKSLLCRRSSDRQGRCCDSGICTAGLTIPGCFKLIRTQSQLRTAIASAYPLYWVSQIPEWVDSPDHRTGSERRHSCG
jgi:DNA-binding beta-propeller fold protein YncE